MTGRALPEATIDPLLKREIDALASTFVSIEDAETTALTSDIVAPLREDQRWTEFCGLVTSTIGSRGYIVLRGLDADEGRSLLIVSRALGTTFGTYGPGRIVKRFRMSPWADGLSHTLRAGDFHTDGNVSRDPPAGTAMQCEVEDPGAPKYAEQRVAYLPDILERLLSGSPDDRAAYAFLTATEAAMASETSPGVWRGHLVQDGVIRYHPQSLRIAAKRLKQDPTEIESGIAAIHRASMDVSVPFHTRPGDTVLVSNRFALHYRGECSVRFIKFPTEFEARSLLVLHMKDQSAAQ
ncbi:MAG TPA: TauD/TfdA family dioxygenase [Longimicrobiaceae bacterium]|nr:TauD/TfdA family dioxygenase [Longimicrobiaceae bacterium]